MKKILTLAVGMLLIPFTAFGMQAMDEAQMDSITGQSGVAISLDNIILYQYQESDELWYTAGDGSIGLITEVGDASFTYINTIPLWDYQEHQPLTDHLGTYDDTFIAGTKFTSEELHPGPSALTVRVINNYGEDLIGQGLDNGVLAIEIGLPTLEVYSEQDSGDSMQILLTDETDNPLNNTTDDTDFNTYSFGTLWTSEGDDSTLSVMGGSLYIMPYSAWEEANTNLGN